MSLYIIIFMAGALSGVLAAEYASFFHQEAPVPGPRVGPTEDPWPST